MALGCLRTAKPAGSDNLVDVELLRPLSWIEQAGAVVGSQIRFELAELGIDGPACVLAIEPCSEIEAGRGRVITGTFTTARCAVLELRLSNGEVLEPSPPHRFYSETRQDWVAAGELRVGELLRTWSGQAVTVESISLKAAEHRVYNLEVEQEHHFFVGESGVLVHNGYADEVRFKRWQRGQPIDKPLPDGSEPSWDTVQSRYWKNRYEAAKNTGEFTPPQLGDMRKGNAPMDFNSAPGNGSNGNCTTLFLSGSTARTAPRTYES